MSIRAKLYALKGLFRGLHESDSLEDPIAQFQLWYRQARLLALPQPNAFALATVGEDGRPSSRMLLLKDVEERGFVFYTNYNSRKARDIAARPRGAMVFYWTEFYRQVRAEGRLERVSDADSDEYFASRPRGSQVGAWASDQSEELPDRETLEAKVKQFEARFKGQPIPRPPHWGGYRLVPERIEFWQGRPSRLHDRLCYLRDGGRWVRIRLSP